MSLLKKRAGYQIGAPDYYYLASELDNKHGLKQESMRNMGSGLGRFPGRFQAEFLLRGGPEGHRR
ncbi:MAG: hypothetical protein M0C28_20745 [Candidatus Moduliflexus flocculans]|nr:hypothetical protein [Candidatus Moduliflexus flocculans]